MNKTIFITGATSGFGKAIAEKFSSEGNHVIITGRREDRLKELESYLTNKFNIRVLSLAFDVQNRKKTFDVIQKLEGQWQQIDVLVNNAGLAAGRDLFDEASLDDWETMIDTNIKGVLYVTKALLPFLIRKKGHVINIGSTAAKEVYEKGNVYCASKSAVDSLSQSMRIDLLRHGLKVTAIHPGAAETEFSLVRLKGDAAAAKKVYEGFQPLSAQDVADVVYYCTTLPAHVCINDLVLTSTSQANSFYFQRTS
ncbi:MAG TPA: SDR family NAD(P)-dependent oxidoreductase [Flavitalea sp.]|nr:SDR family NAD(P)-dependent oxidoreductase [Flavitalea sp.]